MSLSSGHLVHTIFGAVEEVVPVVVVLALLFAYVRLRLSSLLWLIALQVWGRAFERLYASVYARMMFEPAMSGSEPDWGGLIQVLRLAGAVEVIVSCALMLVFVILLARELRCLLENQRAAISLTPRVIGGG